MDFNNKKYTISCINAKYSEDRPNVIGIRRITEVEIEVDGVIPAEEKKGLENNIFNYFAETEYHTEDENWSQDAADDLRRYTNIKNINIDVE